jgi:Zn finger protein HypA/HybF involved in hydrogenase expression
MKLECMECGKKFKSNNADTCCPKCGSVDLELAAEFYYRPAKPMAPKFAEAA